MARVQWVTGDRQLDDLSYSEYLGFGVMRCQRRVLSRGMNGMI